ncbi:hypothetical protein [Candidatus Mycoplasma mahonii]|uniref:hypothetical protein n=1 Tax=Candidatus Mycoplasma mahonii TaxID=3004105 RepID=UPI0026EA6A1F|nr:hypothetical protein [Candidatus Mycoplasma mahonii]WKX02512.1 hypothetical protein O3I44_00310 [Candidatus Mycoplasma mahonii]
MKYKQKILAIFQFISFFGIILFLIGIAALGYSIIEMDNSDQYQYIWSASKWISNFRDTLACENNLITGITSSVFFYSSFILFIVSWIFAWKIFKTEERKLFDSLFLLFFVVPVLSNVFAFIAQLDTRRLLFTDATINKKKIIKDETMLLKMQMSNDLKTPVNKAANSKKK